MSIYTFFFYFIYFDRLNLFLKIISFERDTQNKLIQFDKLKLITNLIIYGYIKIILEKNIVS